LASKEGFGCLACNDERCMGYCDPFRFYFADLRSVLQLVPKISAETNVSDTLIRLLIKYIALRKGENSKLRELLDKVFELDGRDNCSEKKDVLVAEKLLAVLPSSHKTYITKDKLQQLVRVFLINALPVPHINGLGLYPIVVLADHSCKENCYYECIGEKLVLTALTPIGKDQGLTLNFLKSYLPRARRQLEIRSVYQYPCSCELCNVDSLKDETRSFVCKKCTYVSEEECGIVSPKGNGTNLSDWTCHKCGESPKQDVYQEYLKLEETTKDADIVTLKVGDLIKGRMFHPHHFLIYRALEQRVLLLSNIRPATCEKFLNWILTANARVLSTPNHPDRANFYDLLAQIKKMNGDGRGCKEAFSEAATIREKISSKNSLQLALAKQKTVNPEKSEVSLWYPVKDL
jgi:hypothetical protein